MSEKQASFCEEKIKNIKAYYVYSIGGYFLCNIFYDNKRNPEIFFISIKDMFIENITILPYKPEAVFHNFFIRFNIL